MGLMIKGVWHTTGYETEKHDGQFEREQAKLRNWVTADGTAGPSGESGFKAESGRYHLYVSLACPWAHRTLIFRQLKGLAPHISVSVVSPIMLDKGWSFNEQEGSTGDNLYDESHLKDIYLRNQADYSGRVTVPVLWDKKNHRIVSNESAEIIRMFNSAFNDLTQNTLDFYPQSLSSEINAINDEVYETVNNGVYRCGFATSQKAYEQAFDELFNTLDKLEKHLSTHRFLVGQTQTEADWRLFTTLIRFDSVYHGHFKCNRARLEDFSNLAHYLRELYQTPNIAETVNFDHIKRHYYLSHKNINPNGIVPKGPEIDYSSSHKRALLMD